MANSVTAKEDTAKLDDANVRSVISTYLAALRAADAEMFRTAFHVDSAIVHCSLAEGTLVTSPLEAFIQEVAGLKKDHERVEESPRNLTVDLADCIACVRLDFDLYLGSTKYTGTDFFTLAKAGNRWTITHKLYCM